MSIGLRIGPAIGSRIGAAIGVGVDPVGSGAAVDPMAGVTKDATSGKYLPQSSTEWTTVMSVAGLATGNPSALWKLQDASGNPVDAIGTFTLTASGTGIAYQQPVAGWSAKAITTTDGSTGKLINADAGLPNIGTTSFLVLAVCNLPASFGATERSIVTAGGSFGTQIACDSVDSSNPSKVGLAQKGGADNGGSGGITTTAATATAGVHPIIVQVNIATSTPWLYTDTDKTTHAFIASQQSPTVCFGGDNVNFYNSAGVGYMYAAGFFGSAAELTNAQVKKLLQTLGWTVAW